MTVSGFWKTEYFLLSPQLSQQLFFQSEVNIRSKVIFALGFCDYAGRRLQEIKLKLWVARSLSRTRPTGVHFYVLRPVRKPSSFKVHSVCLGCREEHKNSFRWNTFVNDLERLGPLKLDSSCAILRYMGQLLAAVET